MRTFLSDIRYAARMWSRSPGFVAVAVATLALGIGANTTMFSIVNATLLRPLPFPNPDRLVVLWEGKASNPDPNTFNIFSLPNYRDLKARSRTLADIALFDSAGKGYNLTSGGEPEQVSGLRVTASFFRVLGVSPFLGRGFTDDEEQTGRDRVVVLSYGLWSRRYGADPTLVGRTIAMDGQAYTVVGVMPASFQFQFWSGERQLWVPPGWTDGRPGPRVALVHLPRPDEAGRGARADAQRGRHDRPRRWRPRTPTRSLTARSASRRWPRPASTI